MTSIDQQDAQVRYVIRFTNGAAWWYFSHYATEGYRIIGMFVNSDIRKAEVLTAGIAKDLIKKFQMYADDGKSFLDVNGLRDEVVKFTGKAEILEV